MPAVKEGREVRFSEVIGVRMPAELVKRLEKVAEKRYETASSLTRRYILYGLDRDERLALLRQKREAARDE